MNTKQTGDRGEQIAARYLEQKGITILETNWRRFTGEIDIIAEDRGRILFVEVKTRRNVRAGRPSEAVTASKRQHILRTAMLYLQEHKKSDNPVRFDVVEILPWDIQHIESAFDATDCGL